MRLCTSMQAARAAIRGPRSGPSSVVSVHQHLKRPHAPHSQAHRDFAAERFIRNASLCTLTPVSRRPVSGSVLSLAVLCRHVALRDHGKPVGCFYPVPSPTALAFDYL